MSVKEAKEFIKSLRLIKLHPADTTWKWAKKQLEIAIKKESEK
jgi:hypothetical protein